MKTNLLKTLFVAAAAMMGVSAWADTTYSPTTDYFLRPNANYDGWTTKQSATSEGATTFKCNHTARMACIQQYKVTDLAAAKSMTLSLTNGSGSDAIAVWVVPKTSTWSTKITPSEFKTLYEAVTGVSPATEGTSSYKSDYLLKDGANAKVTHSTFIITGTALATLKNNAAADGTITLLLTAKTGEFAASGKSDRTFQSSNSANDEANRPTLTVTSTFPVAITGTQTAGYDKLSAAVSAAADGDVITLYADQEVSGSRITVEKAITIQGKTGSEKILRATGLDALTLLSKANVTLKNLVFDGQSVERSKDAVECGTGGDLTLDGVTFQNYAYTTGYHDLKGTGGTIKLKNSNTFQFGVYLNNKKRVDLNGSNISSENKLNLYVASDYADYYVIVQNCGDVNAINLMDESRELYKSSTKDELLIRIKTTPTEIVETRSTAINAYGTICLPYDATAEGAVVMSCGGLSQDGKGIVFNLVGETEAISTALEAGKPYLYRATAANQKFVATGTTETSPTAVNNFIGVYEEKELASGNYFLYTEDNLFHPTKVVEDTHTYVNVGAYKCYFTALPTTKVPAKTGVTFGIFDGSVTAISNVDTDVNANRAQGKFIQNGQIVIVKDGKQYNAAGAQIK